MNVPNNKRRKESREKITKVFLELMQSHELREISVTEICEMAQVNRTTFYANYDDVYDLSHKVLQMLISEVDNLYIEEVTQGFNSNDFGKLLRHIYANQLFYKTCFKLGIGNIPIKQYDREYAESFFQNTHILYHIEFFRAGFNRVIGLWLEGGCQESPEEIEAVLRQEYQNR